MGVLAWLGRLMVSAAVVGMGFIIYRQDKKLAELAARADKDQRELAYSHRVYEELGLIRKPGDEEDLSAGCLGDSPSSDTSACSHRSSHVGASAEGDPLVPLPDAVMLKMSCLHERMEEEQLQVEESGEEPAGGEIMAGPQGGMPASPSVLCRSKEWMDFTEVGCLFRDLDTKLNALFSDLAGGQEPSNHVVSDVARVRVWESAEGPVEKACVDSSSMMSPAGLSAEIMERQGYSQRKKAVYSGAFRGLGITAALHPRNPHVPSLHLNLRYFDSLDGSHFVVMGSIDVTPFSSASRPLVAQFHRELHELCQRFSYSYDHLKELADLHFLLLHRKEMASAGGIFFEPLPGSRRRRQLSFAEHLGGLFVESVRTMWQAGADREYTAKDRRLQALRRGRFVEFSFLHEARRGAGVSTSQSLGRSRHGFCSFDFLPPTAAWPFAWHPTGEIPEEVEVASMFQPSNWLTQSSSLPTVTLVVQAQTLHQ